MNYYCAGGDIADIATPPPIKQCFLLLILILSGDIETNPGPFPSLPSLPSFEKKDDPVLSLQLVVDKQNQEIRNRIDTTS